MFTYRNISRQRDIYWITAYFRYTKFAVFYRYCTGHENKDNLVRLKNVNFQKSINAFKDDSDNWQMIFDLYFYKEFLHSIYYKLQYWKRTLRKSYWCRRLQVQELHTSCTYLGKVDLQWHPQRVWTAIQTGQFSNDLEFHQPVKIIPLTISMFKKRQKDTNSPISKPIQMKEHPNYLLPYTSGKMMCPLLKIQEW